MWLTLVSNSAPISLSLILLSSGMGKRIKRAKVRKNSSVEIKTVNKWRGKGGKKSDSKAITLQLSPTHWCPASLKATGTLERVPCFYCCAWCCMVWDIPLLSWAQLSQFFFPNLLSTPSILTAGKWETEMASTLCKHHSTVVRTSPCYHHCSSHKSKKSQI